MNRLPVCFITVFLTVSLFSESREVPLMTYHTHAPFYLEEGKGLTYDLADYLNQASTGRYRFFVMIMTRARVDKMLEDGEAGIIPWVSPDWFDKDETLYLWTRGDLMEDGNTVISPADAPIDYRGPDSVLGLRFGAVRGHHYVDIDQLAEEGKITRFYSDSHLNNLRMLEKKRIDFTVAPLKGAEYLIKVNDLEDALYISPHLHSSYRRRIIISDRDEELRRFLDQVLSTMKEDDRWAWFLNQYR